MRALRVPSPCRLRMAAVRTDECAPGSEPSPCRLRISRRPDGRVRARRVPSTCRLRTAAVRMDECALGEYRAPAGYEQPQSGRTSAPRQCTQPLQTTKQPPSGWTSARPEGTQPLQATNSRRSDGLSVRPAATPRTRNPRHNTPSEHIGEQEQSGQGHPTPNTTHQAGTPMNRSQVAQDTAHTKQHTEPTHR